MKTIISLLFFVLLAQTPGAQTVSQTSNYTYTIFSNPDKTFGYDIFDNGKKMIHQPNIPGRPGNKGFKSAADATKVAILVIEKIKKNLFPPTIGEKELKAFKI